MATSGDDIDDQDRLPWLESVEPDEEPRGQTLRIVGLVILGLVAIAALVFAVHWVQTHRHAAGGNGALIEAPKGDYKVKPDQPGGMKAEGEGTEALATSQGAGNAGAAIDLNAVPEKPIAGQPAAGGGQQAVSGAHVAAAVPASGGALTAKAPVSAPRAMAAAEANGSVVQLGAYPDQATAKAQWKRMSTRFSYLAPLGQSVEEADVGGRKVYRLRVNAGSAQAARQLCGKLKVAGEDCFVP
jgi:hypothetical protein